MKVFVSWSGDLSRALAVELSTWLPMVVQPIEAWVSSRDIDPGERWARVLGETLSESEFAILCLTKENMNAPWILFEAGAVARSLQSKVVPLLCNLKTADLTSPLSQFQSLSFSKEGILALVETLYKHVGSRLDEKQRTEIFSGLWPILHGRTENILRQLTEGKRAESSIDVVRELSKPQGQAINRDAILYLDDERKRLNLDLNLLTGMNKKLAERGTTISMEDQAIKPMKVRIENVDVTLKSILDKTFAALNSSQIEFLRQLTTKEGFRIAGRSLEDPKLSKTDFEDLERKSLISITDDKAVITHDLIANYVSKTYPDTK